VAKSPGFLGLFVFLAKPCNSLPMVAARERPMNDTLVGRGILEACSMMEPPGESHDVQRPPTGFGKGTVLAERDPPAAAQRPAFVPVHVAPATVLIGSASIECVLPSGVMLRCAGNIEDSGHSS